MMANSRKRLVKLSFDFIIFNLVALYIILDTFYQANILDIMDSLIMYFHQVV